jgi:hypothetical protein
VHKPWWTVHRAALPVVHFLECFEILKNLVQVFLKSCQMSWNFLVHGNYGECSPLLVLAATDNRLLPDSFNGPVVEQTLAGVDLQQYPERLAVFSEFKACDLCSGFP